MTPQERLAAIRAKAKRPAILEAPKKRRELYWVPLGSGVTLANAKGEVQPTRLHNGMGSLRKPVEKPAKEWRPTFRKTPHALTKISAQWRHLDPAPHGLLKGRSTA